MINPSRRSFLQSALVSTSSALFAGRTPTLYADEKRPLSTDGFRKKLLEGLGGLWPKTKNLNVRLRETIKIDGYTIESLDYRVEPDDQVPALLLIPDGVSPSKPAPAVICLHQHQFRYGKNEPAGLDGAPMHHTGAALAREGYVVLCPDMLCFGERRDEKLKGGDYERFEFLRYLVNGKCLAWKNILDIRRGVDLLVRRREVLPDRLGCYGHSMGSTNTYMTGPWEPRLKCFVCNCCMPTYKAIHREHMLHCFPNFVPGLLQYGETSNIAGLIAPRPLHMNFGELDRGSPIDEVRNGLKTIAAAYTEANARRNFSYFIEKNTGHVLSAQMWRRTKEWFALQLQA
jgi:dienelactone hydrolase